MKINVKNEHLVDDVQSALLLKTKQAQVKRYEINF